MDHRDLAAMARAVGPVLADALAPLAKRLDEMENRVRSLPAPAPDNSEEIADLRNAFRDLNEGFSTRAAAIVGEQLPELIVPTVERVAEVERQIKEVPTPRDGKDADPAEIERMVSAEVERRLADIVERAAKAVPPPENGRDADPADIARMVSDALDNAREGIAKAAAELIDVPHPDPGPPGRDVDMDVVRETIAEHVKAAVAEIPVPKDGRDGVDGQKGDPGVPGKDGVGMAGLLIDRAGDLVATMTDGTVRSLGPIVGKDGAPGTDGQPGKDGRDGFGFEDMTEELADDGRTLIRRYVRGDEVKEFRHSLAVVLDRGVYREGESYAKGDAVSFGGSLFIAQEPTTDKPETTKAWRLAVKRGRDGKEGGKGDKGDPGAPGRAGKDLTQVGPDGRKW